MKKLVMFVVLLATIALSAVAQKQKTPWKIIDMESVTKHGGNCDYDDETLTATFTGSSDRWFDLPDVSGDIMGHTQLNMTVLKSTCILKIALRYKDADGKMQQVDSAILYYNMGHAIDKEKKMKIDLTNKGKIGEEILSNISSIRIAMAKAVDDYEEPWTVQFGEVSIQ